MRTGIQTQTTKTTIELTGRLTLKIRFAVAAVAGCLLVVPLTGTHKHFSDEWGKVSGVSPFFTSQPRKTKGSDPLNLTQELLGHRDVKTTMIYTHVLHRGPAGVRSPLDGM